MPEYLYGIAGGHAGDGALLALFNCAFQTLGIRAAFMSWAVTGENLENFLKAMPFMNIRGAVIPPMLQTAILPLLDSVSERAALAGRCDTIFWRDGILCGENMAIAGFLSLFTDMRLDKMDALLLGSGASAHAAAAALHLNGCANIRISAPDMKGQSEFAERFGFRPVAWETRHCIPADMIINALEDAAHHPAYDFSRAQKPNNGWACALSAGCGEFTAAAVASGRKIIPFEEMQYAFANARFRLWTRQNLPRPCRLAFDKAKERQTCVF